MPPFWRKRKSSSTIDFSLVLKLVNYINNSQQQHQRKKIRWSSSSASSLCPLAWRSARQVVIFFCSPFSPFTAFLQFCSRQSLAAVSLHSLTVYHDKMESLPKGWQSVRHGLYANDNTGGRAGAKPPCQCELQKQQFAESSGKPPCNHFTLYSTDSKVTKKTTFFSGVGSWVENGKWMECVGG